MTLRSYADYSFSDQAIDAMHKEGFVFKTLKSDSDTGEFKVTFSKDGKDALVAAPHREINMNAGDNMPNLVAARVREAINGWRA